MGQKRQRQVAELIHEELSRILRFESKDPRLAGVTITSVEVTPDYRQARIYFTVFGDKAESRAAMTALTSASSFLRRRLAESLTLRLAPDLTFKLDTSLEYGLRIDSLLDTLKSEGSMGEDETDDSVEEDEADDSVEAE
jgi:ribosome-binding factor A